MREVHTIEGWMRSTEKRIAQLERRPVGTGGTGGGGGGVGLQAVIAFRNGQGEIPLARSIPSDSIPMASFQAGFGVAMGIASSIEEGRIILRASVVDGEYGVNVAFFQV